MHSERRPVVVRGLDSALYKEAIRYLEAEGGLQAIEESFGRSAADPLPTGAWGVLGLGHEVLPLVTTSPSGVCVVALIDAERHRLDVREATARGIAICVGTVTEAEVIADRVLTLVLAGLRELIQLDGLVRSGAWRPRSLARDLHGATVGILGEGAAASETVERLVSFGSRVVLLADGREPAGTQLHTRSGRVVHMSASLALPHLDVLVSLPVASSGSDDTERVVSELSAAMSPRAIRVEVGRDGAGSVWVRDSTGAASDRRAALESAADPSGLSPVAVAGKTLVESEATNAALRRSISDLAAFRSGRIPIGCINPQVLWTNTRVLPVASRVSSAQSSI